MLKLRFSAVSRPLPEDHALFSEVDLLLTEIRRCYMELERFWTEEISRAIQALKMRRVDLADFERWKYFHANLKQTTGSWKVQYGFFSHAAKQSNNRLKRPGSA